MKRPQSHAFLVLTLISSLWVFGCDTKSSDLFQKQVQPPVERTTYSVVVDTIGELLTPRNHFGSFVLDDRSIVVAGGFIGGLGFPDSDVTSDCELLLPNGDCQTLPPMQVARGFFNIVQAHGRWFAIGGIDSNKKVVGEIEEFDPHTKTWSIVGALSVPRWQTSAAVVGDSLIVIAGGRSTYDASTSSVEAFDIHTRKSYELSELPQAVHAGVLISTPESLLFLSGRNGGSNSERNSDLWQYNYRYKMWQSKGSTGVGTFPTQLCTEGGCVVAGGTIADQPMQSSRFATTVLNNGEISSDSLPIEVAPLGNGLSAPGIRVFVGGLGENRGAKPVLAILQSNAYKKVQEEVCRAARVRGVLHTLPATGSWHAEGIVVGGNNENGQLEANICRIRIQKDS